jgi:hypothetical protein
MKKLKVGVIDLVSKGPNSSLWARIMHANLASIMPTVVATWSEQEGHDVKMICYTGREDLKKELPANVDVVFICAFTQSALLAYALSNMFRQSGVITVLGGPHARCYPDDAVNYFDYVLGLTSKTLISDLLSSCNSNPLPGIYLTEDNQPAELPGVKERWKFMEPTIAKAPFLKLIPMIGSTGCPYTCSFCIDSEMPYQPLSFDVLKEDLRFLLTKFKTPWLGWHDPNFGIQFNNYMEAIESTVKPGSIKSVAETSLSIMTENNVKRLKKNGFVAMLPGVESWFELGNKSKVSRKAGMERVNIISEQVNMILRHIPYLQTNFVLGLDGDEGSMPFDLTKEYIDRAPGAFPGYSLLTSFGEAAPLNLDYQREDRVIPFPFHFLNNHLAMNIKPRNYEWVDFYDKVIDLTSYTFSNKAMWRRFNSNSAFTAKWMNLMRGISSEGYGRIRFFKKVRELLISDRSFRAYFERETDILPAFYYEIIKKDLGNMWKWLPDGALHHDQNAYLNKQPKSIDVVPQARIRKIV